MAQRIRSYPTGVVVWALLAGVAVSGRPSARRRSWPKSTVAAARPHAGWRAARLGKRRRSCDWIGLRAVQGARSAFIASRAVVIRYSAAQTFFPPSWAPAHG